MTQKNNYQNSLVKNNTLEARRSSTTARLTIFAKYNYILQYFFLYIAHSTLSPLFVRDKTLAADKKLLVECAEFHLYSYVLYTFTAQTYKSIYTINYIFLNKIKKHY